MSYKFISETTWVDDVRSIDLGNSSENDKYKYKNL